MSTEPDVVHDFWIGLLTRQSIVDQLVHVAALNDLHAEDLQNPDDFVTWNHWLTVVSRALGLSVLDRDGDRSIVDAVVVALREQGR